MTPLKSALLLAAMADLLERMREGVRELLKLASTGLGDLRDTSNFPRRLHSTRVEATLGATGVLARDNTD